MKSHVTVTGQSVDTGSEKLEKPSAMSTTTINTTITNKGNKQ